MLALRWRGLDLALGTLTVRESVFEGKVQRPKTQRALRTIPLGPHAVQPPAPVKIAQEQLGHASVQTTLTIYTHVVDASHRLATERLEQQLFSTVPKSQ
jgi:hypothetical protein